MRYVILSLLVLWLGCAHEAARPRSTLEEIPAAARETIRARAGGAEVRTSREGADRYEASWFENGLEREIVVTASGAVVEQESEVRAENVPAVVRDAAVKALGSGTIKYVLLGDGRYEAETVVDFPHGASVDRGGRSDQTAGLRAPALSDFPHVCCPPS